MRSFIKFVRSPETKELFKEPNAFILLSVMAYRARRTDDFNVHGLEIGEALIGDYRNYGLTEQKYRTAKKNLQKWKIASFKTTNKGTIAKLIDTRIYDINAEQANEQANSQATDKQRTANEQATTNKNVKKEKKEQQQQSVDDDSLSDLKKRFLSEQAFSEYAATCRDDPDRMQALLAHADSLPEIKNSVGWAIDAARKGYEIPMAQGKTCSIDGCGKSMLKKSCDGGREVCLCESHYRDYEKVKKVDFNMVDYIRCENQEKPP